MRKFVRIAIIVCLSVAAVPAVLFGSLRLGLWYKTAQVESFYQEHRLLREMRAVQSQSTGDSGPAREALFQILPRGTDKETAIAVLREQGLGCRTIAEPISFMQAFGLTNVPDDNRTRRNWVDCQVEIPNVMGYAHWILDLEFDADAHLNDARVAILNIFL